MSLKMVIDSILPHAECGPNDHRDDALHFSMILVFRDLKFVSDNKSMTHNQVAPQMMMELIFGKI